MADELPPRSAILPEPVPPLLIQVILFAARKKYKVLDSPCSGKKEYVLK